jgi:high affinity Mn2+ porin
MRTVIFTIAAACVGIALFTANVFAQSSFPTTQPTSLPAIGEASAAPAAPEQFSVHGQSTIISQEHDAFHAPYSGPHSLPRHEGWKTSETGTLFLGSRLWQGAEGYFDPEISGGEGFGGVTGIAGFPNGEIPRVGSAAPTAYVARLYLRQDFGFGGDKEKADPANNMLGGERDVDRLSVYVGRFAISDFFDNNTYSHDPRGQFENWALMSNGAWDYPADTRGYTYGVVAEFNQPTWTLRYGAVTEPKTANGGTIDWNVPRALGQVVEFEQRWKIDDHPGAVRPLAYLNMAHMGNYHQAVANPGLLGPDITLSRTYSVKYGFGLSGEQEIADGIGVFGRLGWNDGRTETWAFTEIDRSASIGLSFNGKRWHRPDDVFGVAGVINGLSKEHRAYLGDGGLGFIIGDGQLPHYAPEQILEAYYLWKVADHVFVTPDAQLINHPAYNADRGPVFVWGLRVHVEF